MTEDFACFTELNEPIDFINCINTVVPGTVAGWTIIYYSLILLFVTGWSIGIGIKRGMLIGGFLTSLIGVGLFALGAIPMINIFFALLIMFTGLFLVIKD